MHKPWSGRRRPARLALGLAAMAASLWIGGGAALATTGPTVIARPPRYRIARSIIDTYVGRYRTGTQAPKSRVITSDILITFAHGYPQGGIAIFAYDAKGNVQSELLVLYDFRAVGANVVGDMEGPTGTPVFGTVTMHHVGRSRNLTVLIRPVSYVGPGPVIFRYLGPPGSTANGTIARRTQAAWRPGWRARAGSVGRYRLVPGSSQRAVGTKVTGGELTLFLRQVVKGKPLLLSGILHLVTRTSSIVLYLTHFAASGVERRADVNAGAFLGPVIGTLTGTAGRLGRVNGVIRAQGVPTTAASFVRFSSSPQP